jgi:hypothetical protein
MSTDAVLVLFMKNETHLVEMNQQFLSIADYAKAVRRSRASVYQDIAAGRVPFHRFGPRCLRIPASFLERVAASALASADVENAGR